MRKESEIVTDGSGWVRSSAEVVVSVEGRVEATGIALIEVKGPTRPPPEPPDLNLKPVVTGRETQRKTDPCLKTMPEVSLCTTDGKAELHGADNATNLSPVTAAAERRRILAARTPVATVGEGADSMLGSGPRAQAVRRAMLLNPPPLIAAVFPWDRAARTEPTADRRDGGGGMVQWRSLSLSSFGHGRKEGKRLPSTALSPTTMLREAPPAMNQERDGYGYGYDYGGGNVWEMEEEQRLGGGRLLQEVPSNLLEWDMYMARMVGTANLSHGGRSKTIGEEVAGYWVFLGFIKANWEEHLVLYAVA
ncbi:hypothetical protein PIB30_097476 [Stylosanthes scabra]|uniref:Uncharacterized protein n=1 Tax=Stylosanthes scabra TaxID=79078 RepID=A0ABU6VY71_9FABA|nr:hypothetical protein [Stylosanthes scabra]